MDFYKEHKTHSLGSARITLEAICILYDYGVIN